MKLTRENFIDDAQLIGCDVEAVMAVAEVESRGGGFNPDGSPKTLFEGHWFHKYTKGKYDASHPHISYPKWTKTHYGKTWQIEQARLNDAIALDKTSALLSASFGMFQIMGFNHGVCGFKTVTEFVNSMKKDENEQLMVFTQYILRSGLDDELRDLAWAKFARHYNGPLYAQNAYDVKLAKAYAKFKAAK